MAAPPAPALGNDAMRLRHHRAMLQFTVAAVMVTAAVAATGLAADALKLWECNWCHQQYQGDRPPPFAKCPAKEMKQNHWWIQKR